MGDPNASAGPKSYTHLLEEFDNFIMTNGSNHYQEWSWIKSLYLNVISHWNSCTFHILLDSLYSTSPM